MSTSLDVSLVNVLSRWLAGHATDAELRAAVAAVDGETLDPEAADALEELRDELQRSSGRAELQRAVRETLETLIFGG